MSLDGEPSSSNAHLVRTEIEPTETLPLLYSSTDPDYTDRRPQKDKHRASGSQRPQLVHARTSQESGQDPYRLRLCLSIVFFLIVTCITALILFLMAPGFAQRSLEEGVNFEFDKAAILNVTEGEQSVITMHVSGAIVLKDNAYSLTRKVTRLFGNVGIQTADLTVHHQALDHSAPQLGAMGTIHLPALMLDPGSNVTRFDFVTRFIVNDQHALMSFCKDAVESKMVYWRVTGPVPLTIGWLPFRSKIALDKNIGLEGMNGLQHSEMQSLSFPGTHPLGGISLKGTVGIYNPSKTLSMTIGDVDFGIYLPAKSDQQQDAMIAVVRATDARLLGKQMNRFNVSGRSIPLRDSEKDKRDLLESFLSSYLHGNTTTVHVRGSSFGPEDQPQKKHVPSTPPWLRKALESITISVPFPGTSQSDMIKDFKLANIKIDFSSMSGPLVSGDAVATLQKPAEMQFSMNVTEIDPDVFLFLNDDSPSPFGRLTAPHPYPAKTIESDKDLPLGIFKVISRLEKVPFKVLPGGEREFEQFLDKVFNGRNGKVYVRGTTSAKVESAFGRLMVRDLEFEGDINTKGMDGMMHPPPELTSLKLVKGYPDALHAQTALSINSPSDIEMNLGQLNFMILYNGVPIGNSTVDEFVLRAGVKNRISVSAWLFDHSDQHDVVQFIGEYISGKTNVNLTISGAHPNPCPSSRLLASFLKTLELTVTPPIFDEPPLLQDAQMSLLSSATVLWLRNPFDGIQLQISRINASASYEGSPIGAMYADFDDPSKGWTGRIVLPAQFANGTGVVVVTPKIPVKAKKVGLEAIKKALGGKIQVDVQSTVSVMVDDFALSHLQYQQSANVSVHLESTHHGPIMV